MTERQKNQAASELAKLSRVNPTEAQKAASRANGKKGGRPKKKSNPQTKKDER